MTVILNTADVSGGTPTISNGGRTIASGTDGVTMRSRTNVGSSRPFYFEVLIGSGAGVTNFVGCVTNSSQALGTLESTETNKGILFGGDGNWYSDNVPEYGSFSSTGTSGDRICVAVDPVNGRIWARINNGTWNSSGTANPATNTEGKNIADFGTKLYAVGGSNFSYAPVTYAFAKADWSYTAPTGFGPLPRRRTITVG